MSLLNSLLGCVGAGGRGAFILKGAIFIPSDFPTLAEVQVGWAYIISADVTDNDPTRTNTGQSFLLGDEVIWNGINWTLIGSNALWGDTLTNLITINPRDINLNVGQIYKINNQNIFIRNNPELNTTDKAVFGSINEINNKFIDMYEPTGIADRSLSTISFVNGTLTFSINPTGTDFDYYIGGIKYTTTGNTKVIDDTEGLHLLYYDGTSLVEIVNPTNAQITLVTLTKAIVAYVYWDKTNQKGKLLEERHGITMDGASHLHMHFSFGTQYQDGLALGNFVVDADGSSDSHAQFSSALGTITDEDLPLSINAIASTVGLEIWYLDTTNWRWTTNTGFSVLTTGTGRLAFNDSGVQTEVTNNNFVLCHIFGWNATDQKPIAIQGQNQYGNIPAAREGAQTEIANLILAGLPSPEMKAIGTVIFQTSDTYTNAVKGRVRTTDTGEDYVDFRKNPLNSTVSASDHGQLAGLVDDDHLQYLLLAGRAGGQTVYGGTAASEDLILNSTSHATKGKIICNDDVFIPGSGILLTIGTGTESASPAVTLKSANSGYAAPSNCNLDSNGDKWVFWNHTSYKGAIGFDIREMWFQSTDSTGIENQFRWFGGSAGIPVELMAMGDIKGFVWNDTGIDANFRCEGATDPNLFVLDAGLDQACFGTLTPISGAKLTILGTLGASALNTANGIVQTSATGLFSTSTNLPNGTTATTQSPLDNSTKLATTAYVDASIVVENLWDRAGTDLSPHNSGDDVRIEPGDLYAKNLSAISGVPLEVGGLASGYAFLRTAGTISGDTSVLQIHNMANGTSMIGTETSIKFNQFPYADTAKDLGRMTFGTETNWTLLGSTRDGYFKIQVVKDGVLGNGLYIASNKDVTLYRDLYVPGKLTVDGLIDPTGLILDAQGSAPSTDDGTIYYDSVSTTFKFRENGVWQELSATGLWKKTGTDLLPVTSGDSVVLGLGNLDAYSLLASNLISVSSGGASATVKPEYIHLTANGLVSNNVDVLRITNRAESASMIGTETSLLFKQVATDLSPYDMGQITFGTESNWTNTASTRDGYFDFYLTRKGLKVKAYSILTDPVYVNDHLIRIEGGLETNTNSAYPVEINNGHMTNWIGMRCGTTIVAITASCFINQDLRFENWPTWEGIIHSARGTAPSTTNGTIYYNSSEYFNFRVNNRDVYLESPAINQFKITSGTTSLDIQNDLQVTAACIIDQDLSTTSNPTFATANITGKLTVGGLIDPTALVLNPQSSTPSSADGTIYYHSTHFFSLRTNTRSLDMAADAVSAFFIASGDTILDVNANLSVTNNCIIDQDLSSTSSPSWANINVTNTTPTNGLAISLAFPTDTNESGIGVNIGNKFIYHNPEGMGIYSTHDIMMMLDSNNTGTNAKFTIRRDSYNYTGGTALFTFLETPRMGINIEAPLAMLHIDQAVTDAAIPVLILDQADISEGMIDFKGSNRGSVPTSIENSIASVRVEYNGVVGVIAIHADR